MTARTGGETPEQAAGAQARRFVNESIADQAERFDSRRGEDGVVFQFLCECGRPTCRAVLELTLDAFAERSRRGPVVAHD